MRAAAVSSFLITLFGLGLSNQLYAATADTGTISQLYTNGGGSVAILLANGYPNSKNAGECPGSNGYAGIPANSPAIMKSTLLAAKSSGQQVRLSISGCEGGWYKIVEVYVN